MISILPYSDMEDASTHQKLVSSLFTEKDKPDEYPLEMLFLFGAVAVVVILLIILILMQILLMIIIMR